MMLLGISRRRAQLCSRYGQTQHIALDTVESAHGYSRRPIALQILTDMRPRAFELLELDIKGSAYLSNGNNFTISTPSCLLEILRYLRCLARASLANDYGDWKGLDEIEQRFAMPCDGKQRRRFVE